MLKAIHTCILYRRSTCVLFHLVKIATHDLKIGTQAIWNKAQHKHCGHTSTAVYILLYRFYKTKVLKLVLWRGGEAPPVIFSRQLFLATEGAKFGGSIWVGGVVKVFGRLGGWWNSMILIFGNNRITKIFDKIYACNLVRRLELTFPYVFYRKFHENRMFLRFFSRKLIFAYFLCIFSICSKF